MEYYLAVKKNEIMKQSSRWMEPENITLNEVSRTQKVKYQMFFLIYGF